MPIYNFEKREPGQGEVLLDPLRLADDEEAWDEAVVACGQMIKDLGGELPKGAELVFTVANEQNDPLFTVRVSTEVHR